MAGIDESRAFVAVNIAVLTVSDTRALAEDKSGQTLVERIAAAGHRLAGRSIVKDETAAITAQLRSWIADPEIDVVIATGGTGLTGRDVTPEAFRAVYEKEIEGFGELFRMLSYQEIASGAMLSRATAGVAANKLIFALPGSPAAVELALSRLILPELPHALGQLRPRPAAQ